MELLIVLGVVFVIIVIFAILLSEAEDRKKEAIDKERENSAHEHFLRKYGCTEEEMKERVYNSPAVDKIANIIKQYLPSTIIISYDRVSYADKKIYFKDIGLSNLPTDGTFSFSFNRVLGEALKEKLPGYRINSYDGDNGDVYLINDSLWPVQDHSIKGW